MNTHPITPERNVARFVGWSPTILGRVAFSRIGDHCLPGTLVANDSKTIGQIFGVTRRVSHDGPLPAWIMSRLGRYPYSDWAFFFELTPGDLPFDKSNCHPEEDGPAPVTMRRDERAELHGRMYLVNGATSGRGRAAKDAIAATRDLAYSAMRGGTPVSVKTGGFHEAKGLLDAAFASSVQDNANGLATPIFGIVDVILSRSGMVTVTVEQSRLLTSIESKTIQAQIASGGSHQDVPAAHLEAVANQAFFAIRDLTHQHYHHSPRSDLLTTATPWTPSSDEEWRRQTQYGLTRMAIAVRRIDRAAAFRQALGIVAYADAFQKHFCGWHTDPSGAVVKSPSSFNYDFGSLKASIEASLKVRELKDANMRARLFFMFGTAVTALSILVPAYRQNVEPLSFWPDLFRDLLTAAVDNPIATLMAAAAAGWAVDKAFLNFSLNPDWFERFESALSRLGSGFMGSLRKRQVGARAAQVWLLIVLGLIIAAAGFVSFWGWALSMQAIGDAMAVAQ